MTLQQSDRWTRSSCFLCLSFVLQPQASQLEDNLQSLKFVDKLTPDLKARALWF